MDGLIFAHRHGTLFKLDALALARLRAHAQTSPSAPEAGGVLLGRLLLDSLVFVVDEVSEPAPADRRTRTRFFRSARAHARAIAASLERSHNTCGYLGEWHTHPEPHPRPSMLDLDDWRRRLQEDRIDIPFVLFVIVGTISITAWFGDRANARIYRLGLQASS